MLDAVVIERALGEGLELPRRSRRLLRPARAEEHVRQFQLPPDPFASLEPLGVPQAPARYRFGVGIGEQAQALAERVTTACPDNVEGQIRLAYRRLYGREASDDELRLGTEFLGGVEGGSASAAELWPQYAQVLLGSSEFLFVD